MKKIALLVLIIFITFAQKANAQAKMDFVTEIVDYGEIAKGSDGVRTFEFTNSGNEPLIITKVKSTCGCTVPKKPDGPIAPGDSGIIEVKYDTKRVGPIRKTITVYSNADEPIKSIKIKGKVLGESKSVLEKTK